MEKCRPWTVRGENVAVRGVSSGCGYRNGSHHGDFSNKETDMARSSSGCDAPRSSVAGEPAHSKWAKQGDASGACSSLSATISETVSKEHCVR